MQSALVGSWHNSGFYGHYRGQFKSESAREYRLAAKPQPPAVFLQRCQEPAKQHFFSKHDNRTSFDKANFRSGPELEDLPQRLVHFVQIQPPQASTTYQQNYCQPSRGGHCGSTKVRPQSSLTSTLPNLPGIPKPKLLQHYLHAGVSECLNWSKALKKND
uniref:Domain of unknown function with conserved HDNR motif domain-containing protein n=1 Tax=Rousettus aegyptiacus TaxID=9407 RepID=A0A7J8HM28_ROUAE|nr:hypothetical protein HJG63_001867 [Rousettus aegyptiacus]